MNIEIYNRKTGAVVENKTINDPAGLRAFCFWFNARCNKTEYMWRIQKEVEA